MKKFRLYYNKDKETVWLNEMAQKGFALTKFFAGVYTFEPCEPGEYIYQIDFGDKMFNTSTEYREFMEENDIEIVDLWGYWVFLRKKANKGDFILYTDVDSSIEHYTKILKAFKFVTIIELLFFLLETFAAISGVAVGYLGMILIGALTLVLMNATLSTKKTINELKERKGESENQGIAGSNVSPVLVSGLLLNVCAITLHNSDISPSIITTVHIIAIVTMLYGIYKSRKVFTE